MVTEISAVGLAHSVVAQSGTEAVPRVAEMLRPVRVDLVLPAVRDKQASSTTQVAGAYALLRNHQEVLNQAAVTVREVGKTAEEAGQLLSRMEKDLTVLVKIYPPYPLDNPERIDLLNSFGGLRRQIDALTFPPPESLDAVDQVLVDPPDESAKLLGKPESLSASLDREPMWDIPFLDPSSASDDEVSKALEHVKSMQGFVEELQSRMWDDVFSFVNRAATPEVESKGADIRDLLGELGEPGGIGRNASQLEAAAESR